MSRWTLTALLAAGCAQEPATATATSSVLGGSPRVATDAVVAVLVAGQLRCSGVVTSPHTVLTAAHCIPATLDGLSILAGWSLAEPALELPATAAGAHPAYDGTSHDLGLVATDAAIPVPPLPIAPTSAVAGLAIGTVVTVTGFGRADDGTVGVKRAGSASVSGVTAGAVELAAAPAITCDGDSGGPLFVTAPDGGPQIAGINSLSDCGQRAQEQRVDGEVAGFITPFATAADAHEICNGAACATDVVGGCSASDPRGSTAVVVLALLLHSLVELARRARFTPSQRNSP